MRWLGLALAIAALATGALALSTRPVEPIPAAVAPAPVTPRLPAAAPTPATPSLPTDLQAGRTAAIAIVAGLRAGQVEIADAGDRYPFRQITPGLAWDLARERLVLVDAESERVAFVDLRSGAVRGPLRIERRISLLDRLRGLFLPVAEAKIVASTEKGAALAPDGRRLFVRGLRSDFVKDAQGQWREEVEALGLQVIDLAELREVARLEGAFARIALSPGGTRLLAMTHGFRPQNDMWQERVDHRLLVLDAASLATIAEVPGDAWEIRFTPDARRAYVSSARFGAASAVRLIDLAAGRVLATRAIERHFAALLGGGLASSR